MENTNKCKDCVIGIWYDFDDSKLVTFEELASLVKSQNDVQKTFKKMGYDKNTVIIPLDQYFDKRRSVNFNLFNYCPFCSTPIDKKELKQKSVQLEQQTNGDN